MLALAGSALGQVGISVQYADHAAIPGSVRSVYATVNGTPDLAVNWTATGGCTLASSSTTAAPEVVTAPAAGGTCSLIPKQPIFDIPTFASKVSCRITATSAADPTKSASIVIPVCAPPVQLTTFPESTVLFKDQYAVIQSDLRGSVNTSVSWTITANPGGAGSLTGGAANRHAVFSASAPGTYVLTATSAADPKKKASTTIFVTQRPLPAPNADHTEAIDCTAVGSGKTYDVGPARQLRTLNDVAWGALKPGDTVRIHNDDLSGRNPTTYHQHFVLSASGSDKQPVRICGVPDEFGNKPIVDGDNATSQRGADWAGGASLEELGLIMIYDGARKWDPQPDGPHNILIEGLHLRNVTPAYKFIRLSSGAPTPYNSFASCIHVHTGRAVMLRGNDLENCGQGIFTNSQTPSASIIYDLTVEGNALRQWGLPRNESVHGMYLQAIGLQVQFNYFGAANPGAGGNLVKSRSVLNFLRWNFMAPGELSTAREFDMVEPQAYECYVIPHAYKFYNSPDNNICNPPHDGAATDSVKPDNVAANLEAYHSDYIYGNAIADPGSGSMYVHYGYDQTGSGGAEFNRRGGTLFYWNNTHLLLPTDFTKVIFDPAHPDQGHSYEFPVIESLNNVFAANGSAVFQWTKPLWAKVVVDTNWMKPGYLLPNRDNADSYQGGITDAERATCTSYGQCKLANGHMLWGRDGKPGTASATLYLGPTPFNEQTFLPDAKLRGLAAPLPWAIHDQPSNMEYFPATNTIAPKKDLTWLGALD